MLFFLFLNFHWWLSILLYLPRFHLPPPSEWIYWCSCFFFSVSLISSPASRTIPFFPWDALIILIDSDCPSILKRKRQARIQVLCVFPFLSSASSELCYWLLELLNVQIICLSVPLIPAFSGVTLFIASPIPLKSIISSGGKLHFPWCNLLCYSPSAVYHSTSMYKLCLSSLDQ